MTGASIGVDLGLTTFVATSDGELFANPRPLRAARLRLERVQRRVSRRQRGSQRWWQVCRLLAKHHARVANLRRENHITVARSLVARYDTIYVEDLNIKGLARSALAKSVNDAAWGNFLNWLNCKAEEAGRRVEEVDPRGTSQSCSACSVVASEKLSLAIRTFKCGSCGASLDRDVNAARNILGLGQSLQGAATPPRVRQRSAKRTGARSGHAFRCAANPSKGLSSE